MEGKGRSEGAQQGSLKALRFQTVLVLGAGVLGFLGWMQLYGGPPYSEFEPYSDFSERVWEALTATLGLYATSFSMPAIPAGIEQFRAPESEMALVNWKLDVARILAPLTLVLVVAWALIQGFFGTALRIKSTKRCLSMSRSGLVICGYGELVEDTAIEESKRAGRKPGLTFPKRWLNACKVTLLQYAKRGCRKSPDGSPEYWPIVIVSSFTPDRLDELRTLGVKWIPYDARRQDVLESMGLYRAKAIAALDRDVSWNTDVALRAERAASLEDRTESHVVARAGRDPVIPWNSEKERDSSVKVTTFDFDDIAARAILDQIEPFPGLDRGICQGQRVLVVATDEPVGESLIIEGIRSWIAQHPRSDGLLKGAPLDEDELERWSHDQLRVLLVGTNANARVERILKHQPEIPGLLGGSDDPKAERPVIAGWECPPDYIGDDSKWFEFAAGSPGSEIGPREVPTVLIYSTNRHRAVRAARDTAALPQVLARQGRIVAVTESGPLAKHLKRARNFETIDAETLLSNVSLFIDGGHEQRLARSLHFRWRQRGARKSLRPEVGSEGASAYFRRMLRTWKELTPEEEAAWVSLAKYLLERTHPVDRKLGALEPWEQEGLGYVVNGLMKGLSANPTNDNPEARALVTSLEIDLHPNLVLGAFLLAGISLEENRWASSLGHAIAEAETGNLEASSRLIAQAFRDAEEARVSSNRSIDEMLLEATREAKNSEKEAAEKSSGALVNYSKAPYKFVGTTVKQIVKARKGVI